MRNRLGTPTGRAASGSVEEFERAYESWFKHKIPTIMLYFSKEPVHVAGIEQLEEVQSVLLFKQKVAKLGGLFWEYGDIDEFKRLIRDHLEQEILKRWLASDDALIRLKQEKFLHSPNWRN